jgi:hypothetical protein
MVNWFYICSFIFFLNKFFLDKHQSPGALARSSSANELALRKKNNLTSKKLISSKFILFIWHFVGLTTPNVQSTIGKYLINDRIDK